MQRRAVAIVDLLTVCSRMDVEPDTATERAADMLGLLQRQVRQDLERFKQLIEERGQASGDWRGTVREGQTQ
jgi:hypothetical protein